MSDDVLSGFERASFQHDGMTHDVYRGGTGPAVIVMHEMPGLHQGVIHFAQRLVDAGYSVYLPSSPWKSTRRRATRMGSSPAPTRS